MIHDQPERHDDQQDAQAAAQFADRTTPVCVALVQAIRQLHREEPRGETAVCASLLCTAAMMIQARHKNFAPPVSHDMQDTMRTVAAVWMECGPLAFAEILFIAAAQYMDACDQADELMAGRA